MRKFEYKVIKTGWAMMLDEYLFNEQGEKGWEFVYAFAHPEVSDYYYVFKKEKL